MQRGVKILVFSTLCLIWSSTWIMIKVGLQGAPPLSAAGLRFIIAAFVIFAIVVLRRIKLPRSRSFVWLSIYLGVVQLGGAYALVYWSEQYLSSGLTAILFSTMPLMVALLARIFLRDPLSIAKMGGIALGILGVYAIFRESISVGGERIALGVGAALASAFAASLSSIIVKRFSGNYNPFASILPPHAIAGVLLTTIGLSTEHTAPLQWSPTTQMTVLYLALFGSVSAFALYFWIIKYLDVTVLSYQTFIIPILASVLGWIFLDETITLSVAVGGGLIVAGIALAVIPLSRKRSPGAREQGTR